MSGDPTLVTLTRLAVGAGAVAVVDGEVVLADLTTPAGAEAAFRAAWPGRVEVIQGAEGFADVPG